MLIAFFDDPLFASLYRQTAVPSQQKSIETLNFKQPPESFEAAKLPTSNPQSGGFPGTGDLPIIYYRKLGEGGADLT